MVCKQTFARVIFNTINKLYYNKYIEGEKKGFNLKLWNEERLNNYLKDWEKKQLPQENDLNFDTQVLDDDIRIFTNKILQQNLVAEIMTILTFQFSVGNLAFNQSNVIMERIKRILNLALEIISTYFQFYLKFEFDITLINKNL